MVGIIPSVQAHWFARLVSWSEGETYGSLRGRVTWVSSLKRDGLFSCLVVPRGAWVSSLTTVSLVSNG